MRRILKYKFQIDDTVEIQTRKYSEFLSVQMQSGFPVMWFIVDDKEPEETRCFRIYGTGHMLPDEMETGVYRGTIQERDGKLIWHIFEVA